MKLNAKNILIPTLALFIISVIVAAALAGTNLLTEAKIAEVNLQNEQASCYTVLPTATEFKDKAAIDVDGTSYSYYEGTDGSNTVGYAFITTGSGYGGKIQIVTGIDSEGTITGVYCLDIADETPGLGQNASGDFKDQFTGIKVSEGPVSVNKDGGTIEAMSGATITSRAVSNAVSTAMQAYNNLKEAA